MVAAVLYVDHANHLTPLTLAYHATASRHITTGRTDVIPPSISVECDSAYCPRCLTYRDAASASLGYCQVDLELSSSFISCKNCPICFSPLAVSIDRFESDESSGRNHLICHYLCGHCKWSSRECGVTANADNLIELKTTLSNNFEESDLEKKRQIIIEDASKQLEYSLRQKLQSKNKTCDDAFKSLVNMWSKTEKDENRRLRLGLGVVDRSDFAIMKSQTWSLDKLEQSLADKKNNLASSYTSDRKHNRPLIGQNTERSGNASSILQPVLPTSQQASAQMVVTTTIPRFRSDLLPLPVPLRARVSRRCLAEQAMGKTGILVKPKLNPLEGDSSLRAGHGQWFKKDSSAATSVPRVQICSYGKDSASQKTAVLLKVRNPTLSMIRLRFSSTALTDTIDDCELQNILIDPFCQTFINAQLYSSSAKDSCLCTEWVVLENAEDLFLHIGHNMKDEEPVEVREWNASSALDSFSGRSLPSLRIVAMKNDSAWIEMITTSCDSTSDPSFRSKSHSAFPIEMQIEVGNGSWEASLIKKRDVSEEEIDLVTLKIVVLLD